MKCTIVIPTYNRPNHLKRILSYYHQYGSGLPIIIADSSSEEIKKLNRGTVSAFHDTYFTYLDKYELSTNPFHKIFHASQQVSTEYCVMCADDDFITPSGIKESTAFLDLNPDFTTAYGKLETFLLEPGRGSEPQICFLPQRCQSNIHSESKDRLIYELAGYCGRSFYAVRRTDFMNMIFAETMKPMSDYSEELLVVMLSAIYGKMKCLDTLFSVREACTPELLKAVRPSWHDWMKDKNYKARKQKFADSMAGHLSRQSGINLAESYKIVDKAISTYVKQAVSPTDKLNMTMTDLNLPYWMDSSIRKLYRAAASIFIPTSDKEYSRTSKYYNDSNQIRLCVLANAKEVYGLNP